MSSLRFRIVRQALAMLLMAMCALVSVQRAQAATNDVQHGLAIDHAAPTSDLAHAHGDDHGHDHDPSAQPDGNPDDGTVPGPHHHHAEGPQMASLPAPVMEPVLLSRAEAPVAASDRGAPRMLTFGLERPPKAQGNHRA
jgi:hypothetical protein